MKYRNAAEILPRKLLKELQQYVDGEILYVPMACPQRQWGEKSGSRAYYARRNEEIRKRYVAGNSLEELAEAYGLASGTVRRIIYKQNV